MLRLEFVFLTELVKGICVASLFNLIRFVYLQMQSFLCEKGIYLLIADGEYSLYFAHELFTFHFHIMCCRA